MEMKVVVSHNIGAIGYDAKEQILRVEFKGSGSVYEYKGVTDAEFNAFDAAESKGKHFAMYVKALYPYRRISKEGVPAAWTCALMCLVCRCATLGCVNPEALQKISAAAPKAAQ